MKAVHILILIVGIILTFATESESATINIIGLLMVVYECEKFNLFNNGGNNSGTIVSREQ